jgi:hypothetical protein
MDRREAITRVAWLLGGTIVGADIFLQSGCKSNPKQVNDLFTQDHVNLLTEVSETILPATATPGAKAANVGEFIPMMVKDCYAPGDQKIFINGMDKLNEASKKKNGKDFLESNAQQRTALLQDLDKEQKDYMKNKKADDPSHYFRMMKELTMLGFFTSEVGATKALRYVAVPGKFDGSLDYKKGDKAWATT